MPGEPKNSSSPHFFVIFNDAQQKPKLPWRPEHLSAYSFLDRWFWCVARVEEYVRMRREVCQRLNRQLGRYGIVKPDQHSSNYKKRPCIFESKPKAVHYCGPLTVQVIAC